MKLDTPSPEDEAFVLATIQAHNRDARGLAQRKALHIAAQGADIAPTNVEFAISRMVRRGTLIPVIGVKKQAVRFDVRFDVAMDECK